MLGESVTSSKTKSTSLSKWRSAFDHIDPNYGLPIRPSFGVYALELSIASSKGTSVAPFVNCSIAQLRGRLTLTEGPGNLWLLGVKSNVHRFPLFIRRVLFPPEVDASPPGPFSRPRQRAVRSFGQCKVGELLSPMVSNVTAHFRKGYATFKQSIDVNEQISQLCVSIYPIQFELRWAYESVD